MCYFVHIMAKELNIANIVGAWISSNKYSLMIKHLYKVLTIQEHTSTCSSLVQAKFFHMSYLCSWVSVARKAFPPLLSSLPGRCLFLLDLSQVTHTGLGTFHCLPPQLCEVLILCTLLLPWVEPYQPLQYWFYVIFWCLSIPS